MAGMLALRSHRHNGRDLARATSAGDRVPMADLVLASASPYRRDLLSRLGVKFECVAPEVDEEAERKETRDPIALARTLARKKAEAVARNHKKAIVIGCDQVIALDDVALGKPGTAAAAKEQLKKLSGKEHAVVTACAVLHGKDEDEFVDVTMIRMRELAAAEIDRYLALDKPLDCAGGYKIEQAGIALVDRITGADHTAIIGLPLLRLSVALRKLGLPVP